MPYNDDMVWVYEHKVPSSGDAWRLSAERLAMDIETYLYDTQHPSYQRPEFLSWALARYDATKVSSGNAVDAILYYDPAAANRTDVDKKIADGGKEHSYNPNAQAQFGIKYPQAAEYEADPDDHGEAGLYEAARKALGFPAGTTLVTDPNLLKYVQGPSALVTRNAVFGPFSEDDPRYVPPAPTEHDPCDPVDPWPTDPDADKPEE